MKKLFMVCLAAVLLLGAGRLHAQDTEYKATPVTISRDKVRETASCTIRTWFLSARRCSR